MPKLKLGAAVYAFIGVAGVVQLVRAVRHDDPWQESHGWTYGGTLVVLALTAGLLLVGAVTRWGLISDEGPWVCRNGWILLIGLTVVALVLSFLEDGGQAWPVGPAVFVPHFVRKLQENYYAGQQEAIAAKRPAASETGE